MLLSRESLKEETVETVMLRESGLYFAVFYFLVLDLVQITRPQGQTETNQSKNPWKTKILAALLDSLPRPRGVF